MKIYEYTGCIHVHSVFSDGTGTVPEIVQAGQETGLDFIMLTDHMTLEAWRQGYEGWYGDLLLIIGYEINDSDDTHHYLAFGLEEELPGDLSVAEYVKEVAHRGSLGIAAHPYEDRLKALPGFPPLSWDTIDYEELEVIELWNLMSHWLDLTTPWNKYWHVIHPRSFSEAPNERLKMDWDNINKKRKVTAVASVDAHAIERRILGVFHLKIFPYKVMFKSLRTHILTKEPLQPDGDLERNKEIIFKALKEGNSYLANWRWGSPLGFQFRAGYKGNEYISGDEFRKGSGTVDFEVHLPSPAIIRLFRNGRLICEERGKYLKFNAVSSGNYRVECLKGRRGWIYTNNIYIRDES